MSVLSSRQFNQDVGRAKRAARRGPVIITDRGRPAYVLMRHDAYERLAAKGVSIRALLAQPDGSQVDFEPPRLGGDPLLPAQLM
jgi:prevent-host-death family protein